MNDVLLAIKSPFGGRNQPLAFQLFIHYSFWGLHKLGLSVTSSFAVLTIAQMLAVAVSVSILVTYLYQKGLNSWVILLITFFYSSSPIIGDYSITVIKDTLFGCCIMLLTMLMLEYYSQNRIMSNRCWIVIYLSTGLVLCLIRSNGLMVFIIVTLLLFGAKKSQALKSKTIVAIVFMFLIVFSIYNKITIKLTNGGKHFAESLGVPIAQISYIIRSGGHLTENDEITLYTLLPKDNWIEDYSLSFTDSVKFDHEFNNTWLNNNKSAFLRTYLHIISNNLLLAIKSYFYQTFGLWNMMFPTTKTFQNSQSYFRRINNNTSDDSTWGNYTKEIGLINRSLYMNTSYETADKLLYFFFNNAVFLTPGALISICFLCLFIMLQVSEHKKRLFCCFPCIIVWSTLMIACPASLVYRYSFYLVMSLPCLIGGTIITMQEELHIQ